MNTKKILRHLAVLFFQESHTKLRSMFRGRRMITCLLLAVAFPQAGHSAEEASNERPNFVFFLTDDLNKEYYGCYGHENSPAPTLTEFAKQGMVFDQAFTGQAICAPSRSMIFTGKYPLRNGAFKNHAPVYDGTRSICHLMKELEYDVILCGKSHVSPAASFPWTIQMESVAPSANRDKYTRPAVPIGQLESYFKNRNDRSSAPFCIMATSYYPHGERPATSDFTASDVQLTRFQRDTPRTRASEASFYQAIKNSDDEFAQVLGLLNEYDLADNTVVLFAADHGRFGKFSLKDSGLAVPFVVRWPGVVKPGTRSDALVSFADVLPTILDIAGGDPVQDFDGKSFVSVLKGQREAHHEYVYGVMTNQGIIEAHVFPGRMIRSKRYKYIRNDNAMEVVQRKEKLGQKLSPFLQLGAARHPGVPEEELYDLVDDPAEQLNLASVPAHAEVKSELKRKLQDWMMAQNDFLQEPGAMPLLRTGKAFRLDQEHPRRKSTLPPELKNSLNDSDFYQHQP
jgi:uncharacterized sulfatase